MSKTLAIHIFRRDYRLYDNTSLIEVCKTHDLVLPIFIFTHKQITQNSLRSDNCVQFLCESLNDLAQQLSAKGGSLYIYFGDEFAILNALFSKLMKTSGFELKTVSFNKDMTAYSQQRDSAIKKICAKNDLAVIEMDDITLQPLGSVVTGSTGKMYTKYTPYWRAASAKKVNDAVHNHHDNYVTRNSAIGKSALALKDNISIDDVMKPNGKIMGPVNEFLPTRGGRQNGLKILSKILQWKDYNDKRDMLIYDTTHLSPFNKFGCVSVREVYHAMKSKLGNNSDLLKQLYWRDFFYNLSYLNPDIYKQALNPKFANIKWENDTHKFKLWCEGKTGFPVVDACMREINKTGYMHNRGRLIVSNFLVRLLHIDWRMGEHYFAKMLYDYDPAQNNLGWQIGAATSPTISRPLSQTILNPWIQSYNFDPTGEYIKKWMPELNDVTPGHLHKWNEHCDKWIEKGVKYIKPMVDYKEERERNLKLYKKYI